MHITIAIFTIQPLLFIEDDFGEVVFFTSFLLSVLSSTLGFTRFLMNGPCRILPNSGPCGGYAKIGCLLQMFNISSLMISKCLIVMCFVLTPNGFPHFYQIAYDKKILAVVICSLYGSSLLYVGLIAWKNQPRSLMHFEFQGIFCLFSALGTKSLKIVLKYPALLLTPVFTNWTFGSPTPFSCKDRNQLRMSWIFSWGNLILTSVLGSLIIKFIIDDRIGKEFDPEPDPIKSYDSQFFVMRYCSIFLPIVTYATLILLQLLPKCYKYCCNSCQNNCYPMIEDTILSMETPSTIEVNKSELEN